MSEHTMRRRGAALRRAMRAIAALGAIGATTVLAGCTGTPIGAAEPAAVAPAAQQRFVCPPVDQVAGLTAMPFTMAKAAAGTCSYAAGTGATSATIVIRSAARPAAPRNETLSAFRFKVAEHAGTEVDDARQFSFDAFTARSRGGSCAVWLYGPDGVVTTVTAKRTGAGAARACVLAKAAAALVGTARARTGALAAPIVGVVGPASLRSNGFTERWTSQAAHELDIRIDRVAGGSAGYLAGTKPAAATYLRAAGKVDPASSTVVFVGDASDAGGDRLDVLRAATRTFAVATSRAPRAKLVVVGPVPVGTPSPAVLALRDDLRTAAEVAGATWVDPTADGWNMKPGTSGFVVAGKDLDRALRAAGTCAERGSAATSTACAASTG